MCQCEDRPCCGHAAEERADDQYWEERRYYGESDDFDADWEDGSDQSDDESDGSWMAEDVAMESSLFGDC
jgi:hypothetical protein